jgi:dephospho-CoA kinase
MERFDPRSSILDPRSSKPVIGLIGGIGSGKSAVAAELARHGARVIAGDVLGHEALRQPEIRARLVERWGPGVLDAAGAISRRVVAGIVFAGTPEARSELRALEGIVFPWIERRLAEEIAAARADSAVRFIVVDAAVLLEAGWDKLCERIIYVHAPRALRLRRLIETRGWNEKEVEDRESVQMPLTVKVARADDVIENSGSLTRMAAQVKELLRRWGLARGPRPEECDASRPG